MIDEIRNAHGERLDFTFTPGESGRRDLVVVAHGVTSHKERPWLVALCDALAEAGIASLRFSYSGNGESEGRYEHSTITKEVADLGSVLDALEGWHLAYAGHSMGGAVGTIRCASDPRIRAFVSLAGMVHVWEFMQRLFGHLRPGHDVMLEKPHCPLSQHFLDDAKAIGDVLEPAKRITIPWMIVHGSADEIVPFQDAIDVHRATEGRPDLVELPGVDHRYTGHLADLTDAAVPWLDARLREARAG